METSAASDMKSIEVDSLKANGVRAFHTIEQDIPITYVNNTNIFDPEFSVVVFGANNDNPSNINHKNVAWKVLQAQSGADFAYPVLLEVAAVYPGGVATLRAGPFAASLGDTWAIKQHTASSTPLLTLIDNANPQDTIVVQNIKPSGFTGHPSGSRTYYDIHLIKDGTPIVVQHAVGVNSQAVIQLTPIIYFGIIKDVQHGAIFNSLTDSQYNTPFHLLQYPGGLKVTLSFNEGSGEFTFDGEAKA
eukprot:TRINITY_DN1082_c0_g1_i2.p1 TRINITY_DN1082_c0_g1~~TRINITY_DN1082_c0_g1_i2.p1  ORF type:complete len:246 (+),score=54.92 TRINITY_DN1082_c0_g1_i2:679-1416(+)